MSHVAENLGRVREAIDRACRQAGRPLGDVTLVAVSKTHPPELLLEAARAGQRIFGENRVQEWGSKLPLVEQAGYRVDREGARPADALDVRLIGQLQSNKSRRAAEWFSGVDTLDSLRLAERLHQAALELRRVLPVLLEIKTSHEPSKTGLAADATELNELLERLPDLPGLRLRGLMTIAPLAEGTEVARSAFQALRHLRERLAQAHPRLSFPTLSMGMSGDFQAAIEEGSTEVRIGTAIFGARPSH